MMALSSDCHDAAAAGAGLGRGIPRRRKPANPFRYFKTSPEGAVSRMATCLRSTQLAL